MKIQAGNIIHAHIPDWSTGRQSLKCAIVVVDHVIVDGTLTSHPTSSIYKVFDPESGFKHEIEHWKHFIRPATPREVESVKNLCFQRLLAKIVSELENIRQSQGESELSALLSGYQGASVVDYEA